MGATHAVTAANFEAEVLKPFNLKELEVLDVVVAGEIHLGIDLDRLVLGLHAVELDALVGGEGDRHRFAGVGGGVVAVQVQRAAGLAQGVAHLHHQVGG